jgi:heme/copper-type cytochrome/quinol oxidase subunit 3
MSTDATGLPSDAAGLVNRGIEHATTAASTVGARHVRSQDDRLTLLATRMTIVAMTFFFACFYFALFYLQLVNANGQWLPPGVDHPPAWLGVTEAALVVVAGLVYFWGQWAGLYAGKMERLQIGTSVVALLCLVASVLHIVELHAPGFTLQSGGYVSVFIALEGTFTVIFILTTVVSLGMANRARLGLFGRSAIAVEAFGEFLGWIAAIAVINFLALYVQPFIQTAG